MAEVFNFQEAESRLGVKFKDKNLLKTAFTHSSFANEHKAQSNERLEFLGDSVLGLIVTKRIFKLTKLREGELSKLRALLVSEQPLSKVIDDLGVEELMLKGRGESKNVVSSKAIKCDLYEAIVGAIYLDKGFTDADEFVGKSLSGLFDETLGLDSFEDSKTRLQERFYKETIYYKTVKKGEDHNPFYASVVYINGTACGNGEAGNKRTAEQIAAQMALDNVKKV